MKKLYLICLLTSLLWACNNDETGVIPSSVGELSAEQLEGAICLRWKVPADSNYLYARIQYTNPRNSELVTKNVSVYSDSLLIDGLLAKDGEYHFMLQTVNGDGTVGTEKLQITSRALPVQAVTTKYSEKIDLEVENLSDNCADQNEGILANLIDGKLDNFFHSDWHKVVPFPQWIEIRLPEAVDCFEYKTWNARSKQNPEEVKIYGSNDGNNWTELYHTTAVLPDGASAKYESEVIRCSESYSRIRYSVLKSYGNEWFNLAEFEFSKVWYDIYDPENE